jgi:hypothetical protein
MTNPMRDLERSLREGPPDEADYRAESLMVGNRVALGQGADATATGRVRGLRTTPRFRLVLPGSYLAAILVIAIAGGGLVLLGKVGQPAASRPVAPGVTIPALTETFSSPRNGFSVRYPAGWSVTPATATWPPNTFLPLGNPALDDLERKGAARFVAASQPLVGGQTEAAWLAAFVNPFKGPIVCATDPATSPRIAIGSMSGYLDTNGCALPADTKFSSPDLEFSAIVFAGGRAYRFSLDGVVDLAYFKAVLATIALEPSRAVDGG